MTSVDSAPDVSESESQPPDDYALFYDVLKLIRTRIDTSNTDRIPIEDVRVEVSSSRAANHVSPQDVTRTTLLCRGELRLYPGHPHPLGVHQEGLCKVC